MTPATHDVAIVGGGPAGLAAALRLRQHGLHVAVLERRAAPELRIGESVPADVRDPLRALGVWEPFQAQCHLASAGAMSAWGTSRLERADAFCSPLGGGWHLDRRRFEEMLAGEALRAGVGMYRGAAVVAIDAAHRLVASGAGGQRRTFVAPVVIDATGRSATVARWLGARRVRHDRLVCAHATLAGGGRARAERRTLVEAVEDGWWYAAPLPDGRAVAALFSDVRTFRARAYRTAASWHAGLRGTTHIFGYVGSPCAMPAPALAAVTPHCLDQPAGRDWIAIGDAAASLDPLASAGIALALRDGLEAADAVVRLHDGDRHALVNQARTVQRRFRRYLHDRRRLYALRHCWPHSDFWNATGRAPA
jgi:flavin-dependent dehydrogenase